MSRDTGFSDSAKRFFGPLAVVATALGILFVWMLGFSFITGWATFCLWTLIVLLGVAALGFWIVGDGNIRGGMKAMFS